MKKATFLLLVLISLVILVVRFGNLGVKSLLGIKDKSGINVLSVPDGAKVFLDNQEVGTTPYEDKNLLSKQYLVKVQKDQLWWEGKIDLTAGTIAVVNRELASDAASSAGETLTLEKGRGATIISNPPDASVEIDGKSVGQTPLAVNIDPGEHTFNIGHANYLNRSIRAQLPKDYNLTLSADLALSEADLTTVASPVIKTTPEVVVQNTPTGFLRVRDKPSLSGQEIAQVKPGDSLVLLEEMGAWDRIRLADGREGFVSAAYVEKKSTP